MKFKDLGTGFNVDFGTGFSVNVDGKSPVAGYMVALENAEMIVSVEELDRATFMNISANYFKALKEYQSENEGVLYFGAWIYNGLVYFDVSENLATLDDAVSAGFQRNQLGIYNVETGKTIYL